MPTPLDCAAPKSSRIRWRKLPINPLEKSFFKTLLLLLSFFVIGGCSDAKLPPSVPVDELKAHPETYSGQVLRVHGIKVSGFEFSVLRALGTKIASGENSNEPIWFEFDSNAMRSNSPREGKRLSDAIKKAEKSKAELLFFELEAEGVFQYTKQTSTTGTMHSAGFGHLNNYSSEFRVTRLLSSKYLGGIRIESLPVERKPFVWQEFLFTDLIHSQTAVLRKKPEQGKTASLELIVEGTISGSAEVQVLLAGEPLKQEYVSGNFKVQFREDWFEDQAEVRYLTADENSGTLKIKYTFTPLQSIPFNEIFIPPDEDRN